MAWLELRWRPRVDGSALVAEWLWGFLERCREIEPAVGGVLVEDRTDEPLRDVAGVWCALDRSRAPEGWSKGFFRLGETSTRVDLCCDDVSAGYLLMGWEGPVDEQRWVGMLRAGVERFGPFRAGGGLGSAGAEGMRGGEAELLWFAVGEDRLAALRGRGIAARGVGGGVLVSTHQPGVLGGFEQLSGVIDEVLGDDAREWPDDARCDPDADRSWRRSVGLFAYWPRRRVTAQQLAAELRPVLDAAAERVGGPWLRCGEPVGSAPADLEAALEVVGRRGLRTHLWSGQSRLSVTDGAKTPGSVWVGQLSLHLDEVAPDTALSELEPLVAAVAEALRPERVLLSPYWVDDPAWLDARGRGSILQYVTHITWEMLPAELHLSGARSRRWAGGTLITLDDTVGGVTPASLQAVREQVLAQAPELVGAGPTDHEQLWRSRRDEL